MAKRFTYGGYTFVEAGTFQDYGIRKGKKEFVNITRALHYPNSGKVADGDEPFDYDGFYKAADGSKDDIFFCEENLERYVPCAAVLAVFDQTSPTEAVCGRFSRRRAKREEHERLEKRRALKDAMCMTDKQREALDVLREAAVACCEAGLNFAVDGNEMFAFRADLLADITDNMVPMNGQEQITEGMFLAIENAWDASEGLYANVKEP